MIAAFDKHPTERQDLILTVALVGEPPLLEPGLPTNDEYNKCTEAYNAWEMLVEQKEAGGDVSDGEIELALSAAQALDQEIAAKSENARRMYAQEYSSVASQSVEPVLDRLLAKFADRVSLPSKNLNLIALEATREEMLEAISFGGIERVSLNFETTGFLDVSRANIRALEVHNGFGGVGPYTGAGVKVAVVDAGYANHPRLPVLASGNYRNLSDNYPIGECTGGHGALVAGVLFCQPDQGNPPDGNVGIAFGATPVVAKIEVHRSELHCQGSIETWALDVDAFSWATGSGPGEPTAKILNFSRGAVIYGLPNTQSDTLASALGSVNIDWLVYSRDVTFVHSCGNIGTAPQLSPPSGSYNCVSVGAYDDLGTIPRSDDRIWPDTSPGPTDDLRKKPDISAPGANIYTTNLTGFSNASGTSFAAPHVAGVCALLKEARPSLTSRQIKAILINSSVFVSHPSGGGAGNGVWNAQGGWGALDAYNAVRWRNNLRDDSIGADQTKYYSIHSPSVGEPVVVTLVWHRAMADIDNPVAGSPRNLDLFLEENRNGVWVQVAASASGDLLGDGSVFDNVEQVYFLPTGSPTSYRVRVVRPDSLEPFTENFTLAARRPFLSLGP